MGKLRDKVNRQLSEKYNLPINLIAEATKSQFDFIRDHVMPNQHNVRLPFFGVFKFNESKYKRHNETKNKYKKNKENETNTNDEQLKNG